MIHSKTRKDISILHAEWKFSIANILTELIQHTSLEKYLTQERRQNYEKQSKIMPFLWTFAFYTNMSLNDN